MATLTETTLKNDRRVLLTRLHVSHSDLYPCLYDKVSKDSLSGLSKYAHEEGIDNKISGVSDIEKIQKSFFL